MSMLWWVTCTKRILNHHGQVRIIPILEMQVFAAPCKETYVDNQGGIRGLPAFLNVNMMREELRRPG